MSDIWVVGGGLAGSEAAWQAAERGHRVSLHEMRPNVATGAHAGSQLAELVCSNSLGSQLPDRASGVLMAEMEMLGSLLLSVAREHAVPAGGALAVDREGFAARVTQLIEAHPNIDLVRSEVRTVPQGHGVIASGPLTSGALSDALRNMSGSAHLYFYDALSPIVEADSIDMSFAFRGSRYGRGEQERGDYINCPLDEAEYYAFLGALRAAERIPLRDFESDIRRGVKAGMHTFFEGCLPIEILAGRGDLALAYGPMRPVGLTDPRTGERPFAVVQLRQDDLAGSLYNLVGFQTNLRYQEQRRVLRMIPGLGRAQFARFGQMHRNTFINSPTLLAPSLEYCERRGLFFAGQITGIEGYLGNIASGALAGINVSRAVEGERPLELPRETMLGALCRYVAHAEPSTFQPMKANFGILPHLESPDGANRARKLRRRERARAHAARSRRALQRFLSDQSEPLRIAIA